MWTGTTKPAVGLGRTRTQEGDLSGTDLDSPALEIRTPGVTPVPTTQVLRPVVSEREAHHQTCGLEACGLRVVTEPELQGLRIANRGLSRIS